MEVGSNLQYKELQIWFNCHHVVPTISRDIFVCSIFVFRNLFFPFWYIKTEVCRKSVMWCMIVWDLTSFQTRDPKDPDPEYKDFVDGSDNACKSVFDPSVQEHVNNSSVKQLFIQFNGMRIFKWGWTNVITLTNQEEIGHTLVWWYIILTIYHINCKLQKRNWTKIVPAWNPVQMKLKSHVIEVSVLVPVATTTMTARLLEENA